MRNPYRWDHCAIWSLPLGKLLNWYLGSFFSEFSNSRNFLKIIFPSEKVKKIQLCRQVHFPLP